jgi:opacity protein-like surface antigen
VSNLDRKQYSVIIELSRAQKYWLKHITIPKKECSVRKRLSIATALFLLVFTASSASAQSMTSENFEFDGAFAFTSGPSSYNSSAGFNVGAGYMLTTITKNLQGRIDAGYYRFERDDAGTKLTYQRYPLTVSARYYIPLMYQMRAFGQAGVEVSWDSSEFVDSSGKHKKDQLRVGVSPGVGIEYNLFRNLSVFALFRHHWISDSYFSIHFGAAMHL